MVKRKLELTGFNKGDRFEPLYSFLKKLLINSDEINCAKNVSLQISPIGNNICYDENHFNDYIMFIAENQIGNIYSERYIRVNKNKQIYIGFRIEMLTFERDFNKQFQFQKNRQLMKMFSNRNIQNENFSYYEVRLKNVFEYVYSNGKRSRVIIDDKKLNDILVRFLNVKFYGEFEKVVDLFFGMREGE